MTIGTSQTIRKLVPDGPPTFFGSEGQMSPTNTMTIEAAINAAGGSIADWSSTTTYNANDLVLRVNRIYRALRTTINDDPPDSGNDWVFIGRTEEGFAG